jgi:tight adherence protein C
VSQHLPGLMAAAAAMLAVSAWRWGAPSPLISTHRDVAMASVALATARERGVGRRARRRRAIAVDREVPQMLDLLAAGSRAGLSAELALRQAAGVLAGPLGADLRSIFDHADLGGRWRDELLGYATQGGSTDLRRTVSVLERTERLGSPLTDASRDLAATVRQARRAATLERARTAPVKMLFPLVFLILPAFLLLTVVPVLLTTVRSIG